jgi:hypothetical protein
MTPKAAISLQDSRLRAGQRAFKTLERYRPDLADLIRDTKNNPFYDDKKLPAFYNEVHRLLKENPTEQ